MTARPVPQKNQVVPLDICSWSGTMNAMTTNTNQPARSALAELLDGMIAERKQYASDHGFVATDAEIADSIKVSLLRMARKD